MEVIILTLTIKFVTLLEVCFMGKFCQKNGCTFKNKTQRTYTVYCANMKKEWRYTQMDGI